jgi:hypothetical protein
MWWGSSRCFAKKQSIKDKKKEQRAQEKQAVAKEFEGLDEDDLMRNVKGKFEDVLKALSEQLKRVVMSRVSPQLCEGLLIVTEDGRHSLSELADFSIKNANTMLVIPRDATHKEPIYKVIPTPPFAAPSSRQARARNQHRGQRHHLPKQQVQSRAQAGTHQKREENRRQPQKQSPLYSERGEHKDQEAE